MVLPVRKFFACFLTSSFFLALCGAQESCCTLLFFSVPCGYQARVLSTPFTSFRGKTDVLWTGGESLRIDNDDCLLSLLNDLIPTLPLEVVLDRPKVGLQGFLFDKRDEDMEVLTIGIVPLETALAVVYADVNSDDLVEIEDAKFVELPSQSVFPKVLEIDDIIIPGVYGVNNDCADDAFVSREGYIPVLSGFGLNYGDVLQNLLPDIPLVLEGRDDHHIRRIRVDVEKDIARVCLRDKNGDDKFSFQIYITEVPECFVHSVHSTGYRSSGGGRFEIPFNKISGTYPVLLGFDFEFTDDDHHFDAFGVQFIGNNIVVHFDA